MGAVVVGALHLCRPPDHTFDGKWVDWYLRRYVGVPLDRGPLAGEALFARTALDLPSLIAGRLGWDLLTLHEKRYPPEWLGNVEHTHRALDDAVGYAHLLLRVLAMPVAPEMGAETGTP